MKQRRPLGPDAPALSAIGLGAMALSIHGRPSQEASIRVIHSVLEAGVTLIDTADVYCLDNTELGHNERLIATALRSWSRPRDELVVATKGGMTRPGGRWERDGRPEHLRAACERSLRALAVERIDLYQLHAPDPHVPFSESVGALADLQKEGKVRWVGLSNVTVERIKAAEAIVPVVTVQNRVSPFFREALETGIVEYCARAGIGFLAYSPVGGRRLTTTLPGHPTLRRIARRRGVSAHAIVLAWLLATAPNVIPIPSARTVGHALDSLGAVDLELSDAELRALDGARFALPRPPLSNVIRARLSEVPWLRAAYRWVRGQRT